MQVQIVFKKAFPAVFDTKDLTDAASVDGVIVATMAQLSHSEQVHPDPKTGKGEFAGGLWCHIYGYDYRARNDDTKVVPLVVVGHVPILSAEAAADVLEIKAGNQTILKRDAEYGMVDVQMLYTTATTYLDNSASLGMISVVGELHKFFSKEHPDLDTDAITVLLAEEIGMPLEVVADAVKKAFMNEEESDEDEDGKNALIERVADAEKDSDEGEGDLEDEESPYEDDSEF